MSYSQNGEEKVILDIFGDHVGRFLDIGAWDGKTFSNTAALVDLGWNGVLVEASPHSFDALANRYEGNDRLQLVCAAMVTRAEGPVLLHETPDALSTTVAAHRDKWASQARFRPIHVGTFDWRQLIDAFGDSFDMVTIDTEGTSALLYFSMPPRIRPRVIVIEHDSRVDDILAHAGDAYRMVYHDGNNVILGRLP